MNIKHIYLLLLFLISPPIVAQQDLLRSKLNILCLSKRATIGVGILDLNTQDTILINNQHQYPMQSVFKFHLALAVLDQVDKRKLALDQKVWIAKKYLLPDTWSPMRDQYPMGDLYLSLQEILTYTVAHSDNNGCDILFRLIGGPAPVNKYIHSLGIADIAIKATEEQMHKKYETQFSNWTTPMAAVQSLQLFYNTPILSKSSREFLWNTLVQTSTGSKKIKGLLPPDAIVGHKTGYSGANLKGITAASNDIGILVWPNGKIIALAIFISQSSENEATNDKIIAEVAKAVWDHYSSF